MEEGISEQAWLALLDARSSGLLDRADAIETVDTRDRLANVSTFGEQGYDMIVTIGAGMTDETIAAAQLFGDLRFIAVQQSPEAGSGPDNVALLLFHEERSGFLAGSAAALISQTRHVAAVCEAEFIDAIRRSCEGFRAGAAYVDSTVAVEVTYRSGSQELLFHDVEWARAATLLALDGGADVVFAVGEETAEAALATAAGRGALVIGAETDQYAHSPEIRTQLATSAVLDVRSAVRSILEETIAGRFPAGENWGRVGLAPLHDLEGRIPPHAVTMLQTIANDLEAGVIDIGTAH